MTTEVTITPPAMPSAGPGFGGIPKEPAAAPGEIDYLALQRSPEFAVLRRRLRAFVFPMSALFFGWYLCYVLLAAYAHDLMSQRLVGQITVGLVLGVAQFGSTILIMISYLRYARRRIDPQVALIRSKAAVPGGAEVPGEAHS
jgi:uncharacterized membrane protein (DUF485 family)